MREETHLRRPLPGAIVQFWVLSIILFGTACLIVSIRGQGNQQHYPYNTFLFDPAFRFSDFTDVLHQLEATKTHRQPQLRDSATFPPFGLFPPAGVLVNWPMSFVLGLRGYLGLLAIVVVASSVLFFVLLRKRDIAAPVAFGFTATLVFTSYPLMFLVDRLNNEGIAWILVSGALFAILRQKWWTAAMLLSIATAFKIFPVVMFALFVSQKKWRELAVSSIVVIVLTFTGLAVIRTSIPEAWGISRSSLAFISDFYLLHDRALQWGFTHSLFSIPKQLIYLFSGGQPQSTTDSYVIKIFLGYQVFAVVAGLALYFFTIRRRPFLNQIIALTVCSIWLPWWSADYTLVHLYVPFGLFVLWIIDTWETPELRLPPEDALKFLIPFAVLFTPQSYFIVLERGFGGQIKSIALLVLLDACLHTPLVGKPDAEAL